MQGIFWDITERKRAEQQLKSERDKLQAFMDGLARTHIGIDIVGIDYTVLFQSQILKERFGDLTGRTCYENYMGLKKPCDFCPMIEAVKSNRVKSAELIAADGREYEILSAPLPNPDGTIDKAVEVVVDITERKQAEEALRRSERQASAAIEAARAFTFNYHIATGKVNWGGAVEKITGYTPEEFAEIDVDGWAQMMHPDDKDRVLSILQEAIQVKDRATAEYRFRAKNGGYVTLSSISLTEKEEGKAVRLVGILQDITERKQAEEALRESERRYRELFDSANDILYVHDLDLNVIAVNETARDLLGYSEEEARSMNIRDIVAPESLGTVLERFHRRISFPQEQMEPYEI